MVASPALETSACSQIIATLSDRRSQVKVPMTSLYSAHKLLDYRFKWMH